MPNPADPRRSAQVLIHHHKKIDDELWRRFFRACRDPYWPPEHAWSAEATEKWLEGLHREEWLASAGFFYPHPFKSAPIKYQNPVQVSHRLRMAPRYGLSSGRMAEVPRFASEGWNWVAISSNSHDLAHTGVPEMTWFLERVRVAVQFFEPDFACGALDTQLHKGFREEPRDFAWPVLVYGPGMVEQVGRERLLSAPAFLVEELTGGAVWLQAAENPFIVEKSTIKSLAKHLNLRTPDL